MDVSHFVYPFINWWTFYKYGYYEYAALNMWVILLSHIFNLEELPACVPKWLHHFTTLPALHEGSSFSISPPTLVFILATLLGENFIVVLICISLLTNDVQHLFLYPKDSLLLLEKNSQAPTYSGQEPQSRNKCCTYTCTWLRAMR